MGAVRSLSQTRLGNSAPMGQAFPDWRQVRDDTVQHYAKGYGIDVANEMSASCQATGRGEARQ
jgi:hypothetical protein